MKKYDIAIIGFGATGVTFLRSLQSFHHEQNLDKLKIVIVSEEKTLALGKAFQECDEIHRVNTPPELMSVQEEDILGFKHWLDQNLYTEKYPPRHMFARYLKETFNEIKKDSAFEIDIIESEAVDIKNSTDGLEVKTLSTNFLSKKIVLCLGSLTSTKFSKFNRNLALPSEITYLKSKDITEVAVAGTGLTAIDCIRQLKKQGAKKVYIFSRKNMLPTPITTENKYIPKYFIWQNIKKELILTTKGQRLTKLLYIFKQEIDLLKENEYIHSKEFLSNEDYLSYFTYILNKSKSGDLPIQDILTSTRRFAHKIWKLLSEDEKINFQRNYSSAWAVWRHPIPIFILEEIKEYFQTGFIEVIKSPHIEYYNNKLVIKSEKTNSKVKVNTLVDATGGTMDILKSNSPLIKNLLIRNLISPHICGGIRTNSLNFKVKNNQGAEIYNLGPLSKGDLFSTNAFWYNSKCANELAYLFANNLKESECI